MKTHGLLTGPTVEVGGPGVRGRRHASCSCATTAASGVNNGVKATVAAVDTPRGTITVGDGPRPQGDRAPTTSPAGHVAHGYATTIHKAQGATVDRAFLLGSDTLYREAGYTGAVPGPRTPPTCTWSPTRPRPGPRRPGRRRSPNWRPASGSPKAQLLASDQLPAHPAATAGGGPADRRAGGRRRTPGRPTGRPTPPRRAPTSSGWTSIAAKSTGGALCKPASPPNATPWASPPSPTRPTTSSTPSARRPTAGADRQRWAALAGRVEAYRHTHGITDAADVLGPRPEKLAQLRRVAPHPGRHRQLPPPQPRPRPRPRTRPMTTTSTVPACRP